MTQKFSFTKAAIEALPIPEAGKRAEYWDAKQLGLQIRVTATGSKSYYVRRRINGGQPERILIGRCDAMTIEQARSKAARINADIAIGKNPAEVKRGKKAEMTLGELFEEYIERHAKPKGKKTIRDMQDNFRRYLGHWQNRKLSAISKADVIKYHAKLGKDVGPHTANRTLELLRAVINKGIAWDLFTNPNPAVGIEKFRLQSRDRFIQGDELPHPARVCNDPVNSCSGIFARGDTDEHDNGRRDQTLDSATQVGSLRVRTNILLYNRITEIETLL